MIATMRRRGLQEMKGQRAISHVQVDYGGGKKGPLSASCQILVEKEEKNKPGRHLHAEKMRVSADSSEDECPALEKKKKRSLGREKKT